MACCDSACAAIASALLLPCTWSACLPAWSDITRDCDYLSSQSSEYGYHAGSAQSKGLNLPGALPALLVCTLIRSTHASTSSTLLLCCMVAELSTTVSRSPCDYSCHVLDGLSASELCAVGMQSHDRPRQHAAQPHEALPSVATPHLARATWAAT
jgi:hypothetical protein